MALVVPMLAAAWAGQLADAAIPFPKLNRVVVPFVEMGVGAALLVGFYTRIAARRVGDVHRVADRGQLAVGARPAVA